ncbi:MAG: N-acetylmuramoyl-L-alanine amidase [Clostridia bacterium]|nr:N-acetylmuramoyl-L-alanine amidase [Clostridia bacterium]
MATRSRTRIVSIVFFIIIIAALTISASAENGKYVIIIDPGHGGIDGGTDEGVLTEKEYNLILAKYLREELSAHPDFEVHLTREGDEYLKFLPRALEIVEHNADLLISLHCNSNTYSYVSGCDAFISVVDEFHTADLAGRILDGISSSTPIARGRVQMREDTGDSLGIYYWNAEKKWDMPGASWLGKKSDFYSMCTWPSKFGVSSIIVEHGYLSNPGDRAAIANDANLRAMAKAEADAIISYFTGHEHTYTAEKVIDFPSNCTLSGTKSYRCTYCGAKKDTEALPADPNAHYYRCTAEQKLTCTQSGYAEYVCQISFNLNDKGYPCPVHTYSTTEPAPGHNYVVTENIPATHGSNGKKTTVCQTCGDTITEVITGDAHNYDVIDEKAPTCTGAGSRTSLCSVCGFEKTEILDALGHDFAVVREDPVGPEVDGCIYYSCTRCAEEMTETIPHCEHEYVIESTDPTCTEDGSVFYVCQKCGYEKTEVIPATGHDHKTLEDTPPSCTLDGIRKVECLTCGDVDDLILAAPGHSFELTYDGIFKSIKTCTVCGEEIEDEPTSKTPGVIVITAAAVLGTALVALAVIFIIKKKKSAPAPTPDEAPTEDASDTDDAEDETDPTPEPEFAPEIEYADGTGENGTE